MSRPTLAVVLIVCACLVTGFAQADDGSFSNDPAACSSATHHVQKAKATIDTAFAKRKWRSERPVKRSQRRAIATESRCAGDDRSSIRRYAKKAKHAFYRHADSRFRRCEPSDCRRYARRLVSGSQFQCLDTLWGDRESGWYRFADNPTSSAYGIPQALPGSKMGPGWEWDAKVQIHWGLDYIDGRYGSPCGALGASLGQGWY